jgi:hypothetical protein
VAYVVHRGPAGVATAERVLADLLDAYGRRPDELSWYLASMFLRRAPRPFRYLEGDWPTGVETMVTAAEDALGW